MHLYFHAELDDFFKGYFEGLSVAAGDGAVQAARTLLERGLSLRAEGFECFQWERLDEDL